MPLATTSIALVQAILFLDSGWNPVSDADFKALGLPNLSASISARVAFILAARAGELPLCGTLCFGMADFDVPGQKHIATDGGWARSRRPKITIRRLVNDFAIPAQELTRDLIEFERSFIRCDGVPTGADPLPEPKSDEQPFYCFEEVRVGAVELRALRSVCAASQQQSRADDVRLKPGPKLKYDYGAVMAEVVAILHEEGLAGRSLAWLVGRVKERMGEDAAPGVSTLKQLLGPIFRHKDLKAIFAR